jgi:hypothetical protein
MRSRIILLVLVLASLSWSSWRCSDGEEGLELGELCYQHYECSSGLCSRLGQDFGVGDAGRPPKRCTAPDF